MVVNMTASQIWTASDEKLLETQWD